MRPSQLAIASLLALGAPGAHAQKNVGGAFPNRRNRVLKRQQRQRSSARRHLTDDLSLSAALTQNDFDMGRFKIPEDEDPTAPIVADGSLSVPALTQLEFDRFAIPTTTLPTEVSAGELDDGSMSLAGLEIEALDVAPTAAPTTASPTLAAKSAKLSTHGLELHTEFMMDASSTGGAAAVETETSNGKKRTKAGKEPKEKSEKSEKSASEDEDEDGTDPAPRTKAGKARRQKRGRNDGQNGWRKLADGSLSMATEDLGFETDFGRFDIPLPTEVPATEAATTTLPTEAVVEFLEDDGPASKGGKERKMKKREERKRLREKQRAGRNGSRKLSEASLSMSMSLGAEEFMNLDEDFVVAASSNGDEDVAATKRKGKGGKKKKEKSSEDGEESEESETSVKSEKSEKSEKSSSAKSSSADEESEPSEDETSETSESAESEKSEKSEKSSSAKSSSVDEESEPSEDSETSKDKPARAKAGKASRRFLRNQNRDALRKLQEGSLSMSLPAEEAPEQEFVNIVITSFPTVASTPSPSPGAKAAGKLQPASIETASITQFEFTGGNSEATPVTSGGNSPIMNAKSSKARRTRRRKM